MTHQKDWVERLELLRQIELARAAKRINAHYDLQINQHQEGQIGYCRSPDQTDADFALGVDMSWGGQVALLGGAKIC